ncbi:MAG: PKD domain-containing protein [Candidatus Thermoplasmatota archaeon]|nr:PKD domain-containing protein [Candidatus Thermoplasmatota archaeon]
MRHLALLVGLLLMTAGCIDLDRGDEPNQEPLAKAKAETAGPYEPGDEIWFTGAGSSDPDGDALDFFWDFDASDGDDNERIVGQGDNGRASHPYHEEGNYIVTLTVRDLDGAEDTATVQVTVAQQTDELRAVVSTEDETEAVYHPAT